ncbi:MAG: hypothetical protein ABFE01_05520, partial [Phycisphaerales bacterium]
RRFKNATVTRPLCPEQPRVPPHALTTVAFLKLLRCSSETWSFLRCNTGDLFTLLPLVFQPCNTRQVYKTASDFP